MKNRKLGKQKYPKKTSYNFLTQEQASTLNSKTQIIIFALIMIILLVIVKFAVVDRITAAYDAEANYNNMKAQIAQYKDDNKEFDKVKKEYSHYGKGYLNEQEKIEADRVEIFNVIDKKILNRSSIQTLDISGNVATITIDEIRLKTVSLIVAALEKDDMVSHVTVSTAETEGSPTVVSANMNITFKDAGGDK